MSQRRPSADHLEFFISHIGSIRDPADRAVISLADRARIPFEPPQEDGAMTVSEQRQRTVIQLDGVFDVPAARQLAAELDEARYGEVRIDLTRVREFHDFGVALLAQTIAGRRAPTAVLGLHEHHLRLLKYLGIDCDGANLAAGIELV